MIKNIEIWADSFHEGNWCCDCISDIAETKGYLVKKSYLHGFQPYYQIVKNGNILNLTVYGSYRSWSPVPDKISELIKWGKPDFIAFDSTHNEILFAVEETAATPTGNQPMQRCERQYGSSRLKIPYWYLISEFGVHKDGGIRHDSIWPTIAAIKLSIIKKTPCVVLHYSDIDNPENYGVGSGVSLLFNSLFLILENHLLGNSKLENLKSPLKKQYEEMITFVLSHWESIIDFLPSEKMLRNNDTAEILAEISTGDISRISEVEGILVWPKRRVIPVNIQEKWIGKNLLKQDPLCLLMERDITHGKAYYLSDNAGSGKPPLTSQLEEWISQQEELFKKAKGLNPPANFTLKLTDFPDTGKGTGRHHVTTAKNIVYLYDSWNEFVDTLVDAYPRLSSHLVKRQEDVPVFVYVSNSIKPGRLFGDPYTGQLSAYSTAFGKFDDSPRMVVAYFPHQVHTQAINDGITSDNKGLTLMTELTDYLIFHSGVAVDLKKGDIL